MRTKTTTRVKVAPKKKTMHLIKKIKVHDAKEPVEVTDERAFWVHDGGAVKSLKDLYKAIASMTPEQFAYHTVRNGNDFARWIRDVLLDPDCADKVERADTQVQALHVLKKESA
jgi:hypothetical protein